MKLNIVIDASSMFYRSLFTVRNYGVSKGEKLLDTKKSQGIFMRKLATDFTFLIRDIENPARVIVCLDSSSWRKSIIIEEGGYKNDRKEKKQEFPINWNVFYEMIDKFATILSQNGYIISKLPGAEADDLLYLWSRKLNTEGENVILITSDKDLLQTVCRNSNGTWTISLDPVNKRRKVFLTKDTFDSIENTDLYEPDIFNPTTWLSPNDVLKKLISEYELNIVNPKYIALKKVILGDGSDTVPSIITWHDKKEPEKIRTMTESNFSKIEQIIPKLMESSWEELLEGKYLEEISSTMEDIKKIKVDRDLVLKNIERNVKLVILSEKVIPEQIQINFKSVYHNTPELVAITNRDSILAGTEWWSSDKISSIPKTYDLFED